MFEIFIVIIGGGYWIVRAIIEDVYSTKAIYRALYPWRYDKNGRRIRKK